MTDTNISTMGSAGAAVQMYTSAPTYYLGYEVQGIGDTNADGYDDLIVMATRAPPPPIRARPTS